MRHYFCILLLILATHVGLRAENALRTWTDVQGRTAEATLLSISGEELTVKTKGGKTAVLKLSNSKFGETVRKP